jgi:hypothetical protein
MKRIFALVLSFAVLFSCLVLPAGAMFDPTPVYQVQAQSAYIVNTDTNIIVYDKDSTKQVSAGGLTKYMTLAVLLTNYADNVGIRVHDIGACSLHLIHRAGVEHGPGGQHKAAEQEYKRENQCKNTFHVDNSFKKR